jgi:hypothetical protein
MPLLLLRHRSRFHSVPIVVLELIHAQNPLPQPLLSLRTMHCHIENKPLIFRNCAHDIDEIFLGLKILKGVEVRNHDVEYFQFIFVAVEVAGG